MALNAMQARFNFPKATKWDRSNLHGIPLPPPTPNTTTTTTTTRLLEAESGRKTTERHSSRAKKSYKSNPKAFRVITIIIIIQNSSHLGSCENQYNNKKKK